jgi:hypothetical protein
MEVAERVSNGIALLDELEPNWRESIDLEMLNIATCTNCILGQLSFKEDGLTSTDYSRWLDKRYKTYARDRHELGFTVYNGPTEYYYPSLDDFNSVTAEWKRRLNDRS